jgi:3-deoxy-D-manno-octulosonic-acid transferase
MPYLLDAVYLLLLIALSPWLIYKAVRTGKYRRGFPAKLLGLAPKNSNGRSCVWFHGVSVGEIHLLRQVVAAFRRRHPDWQCAVSTTTDTGLEEARKHFPDLTTFCWPFDFSWAVRRALRRIQPSLVVLAEGEIWPNFLLAAARRAVPVAVINGRMSPRSARRYRALAGLVRPILRRVALFAMQSGEYATHLRGLGVDSKRVHVTGSVKYDGVTGDRTNPRTAALGRLFAIGASDFVWVAGSTQAPEEAIVLDIFRRVRKDHANLRLILVPRQRDRFGEVAALLERSGMSFALRSGLPAPLETRPDVVLIDTIGELAAAWGLADVAFVGGSLDGKRGGQNMIEPAAYGAAVVFGPHVWNFRDAVDRLLKAGAAVQVNDSGELQVVTRRLLQDEAERRQLGQAARLLVNEQQGATERTIDLLDGLIAQNNVQEKAA